MTGDTRAPERLGPYRLLSKIGEGGMGAVHLGLDENGREVAVKVLHSHVAADLKARDRLTREVETMRRVRSPYVAEVLDAQLTGAQPYIVTRFAPGRTLEDTVLQDGPLPDDQVIRLARGCAPRWWPSTPPTSSTATSSRQRDARRRRAAGHRLRHRAPGQRHPAHPDGHVRRHPGYLAPEIIRDSEITQAADVHALASTVFFAATGKPPFGTGAFEVVCFNIMEGRANFDLAPAWLRGWLRQALNVDAAARPGAQQLHRMARALDPAVTAFHEEPPPTAVLDPGTKVLDPGTKRFGDGPRTAPAGGAARLPRRRTVTPAARRAGERHPRAAAGRRLLRPAPAGGVRQAGAARAQAPRVPERAEAEGAGRRRAPPPYVPAGPPPPYVPAPPAARQPGFAPPPYPDQRVAGYPAPRQAGPAQPVAPPPARPRPNTPPAAQAPARAPYRAAHPLAGALLLAIVVALACVLPVIVSASALVAVVCLRVGSTSSETWPTAAPRGSSASDPLLAVVGTPWALIKAGAATLITAPVAAMFGMCVWGALVYIGQMGTDKAAAYAAGAFVAGLFVLPGGGKPRKAVSRVLTGAIRSPGAAMVTTLILGTIAFFTVMAAIGMIPSFTPWDPPSEVVARLTREWKAQAHESAMGVMDLIGGLVDDLLNKLGLGFLTFWK
nr:hypothetical protein GCM10020093_056880 [Planobispora longispora]